DLLWAIADVVGEMELVKTYANRNVHHIRWRTTCCANFFIEPIRDDYLSKRPGPRFFQSFLRSDPGIEIHHKIKFLSFARGIFANVAGSLPSRREHRVRVGNMFRRRLWDNQNSYSSIQRLPLKSYPRRKAIASIKSD